MIRHGYIRDVEGTWYSVKGLEVITVVRSNPEYPGDNSMGWDIVGGWVDKDECFPLVLQDGYGSELAAQIE